MRPVDGPGFASFSGATRTGKTSLVKALLRQRGIIGTWDVVFFDPKDEYGDICDTVELREFGNVVREARKEKRRVCLRVVPSSPENEAVEAGILAQWVMHFGGFLLIIDEAHDACSSGRQGLKPCSPRIIKLAKRGGARQVGLWTISQRPADVHLSLRSEVNSQETWFLLLVEAPDLDVVRDRGGLQGKELREKVAHLKKLHAIRLRPLHAGWENWKVEHEKNGPRAYRLDY